MVRVLPRSVHARLVTLFAALTTLALIGCLGVLYLVIQHRLDVALDTSLATRSDDLTAAVAAGDLAAVAGDPLAQLYSADGDVLAGATGHRLLSPAQVRAVDGRDYARRAVPIERDGGRADLRLLSQRLPSGEVLTVAARYRLIDQASGDTLLVLAVAAPLLVALVAVAGGLVVRAALRPVDRLTREAATISTLDTGRRLPSVPGDDEIARLASTLDAMLDRLRVAFDRERAFVDDASHELRTPIAVLRGEIDLALGALDDPAEVEQSLVAARSQVVRLTRLAEDLLLLARERAGALAVHRQPVDLRDLAEAEARLLGPITGVHVEVTGAATVDADPDRLRQVLTNLVTNSAAAGAQTVRIDIVRDGRDEVGLRVADDGPGFPDHLLPSVFDRFVRGAAARSGSGAGLGLSIVRAVATAHDGTVDASNGPPLGGARVTVRLPAPAGDM